MLCPGAGDADAEVLVSRLRQALAGRVPVSIGWSRYPGNGSTAEELFKQADARLYAAKPNQG